MRLRVAILCGALAAPAALGEPVAPAGAGPMSPQGKVMPAVVGIAATLSTPTLSFSGRRKITAEAHPSRGIGSGIVIGRSGLVLTCAHVLERATAVRVFLGDGRELPGRVLVADEASDLALLRVAIESPAAFDLLEKPSLDKGERVYLASRPGGTAGRFEEGELAAPGTFHLGHSPIEFFRGFLGSIEPGDSGGALVDERGRLIGLVSVGHAESGTGYAVAREFLIAALYRLGQGEPVVWPWLGIGLEAASEAPGAGIWTVAPGSPADRAGLEPGDRVLSIDGKPMVHFLTAMLCVIAKPVGTPFTVDVLKKGAAQESHPTAEAIRLLSAPRPVDPPLPPLDLFERLTGIRLAMTEGGDGEPAGLRITNFTRVPAEKTYRISLGSRLVAMVPGLSLIESLEEGRTNLEVKITSAGDLAAGLRASSDGGRLAAVLVWSTGGELDTMVLSGEAREYPFL